MVGARTDGMVFVSKFNKIRREHARKTVQRIQDAGIYILGTVINDIDFEGGTLTTIPTTTIRTVTTLLLQQ